MATALISTAGAIGTVFHYIPILNKLMAKEFPEKKSAASYIYQKFMIYLGDKLLSIVDEEFISKNDAEDQSVEGLSEKLIELLIKIRAELKAEKNYKMADAVRNGLKEIGVALEDAKAGTTSYHIERKS